MGNPASQGNILTNLFFDESEFKRRRISQNNTMKITVTSETTGTEVLNIIANLLACSDLKILAQEAEIKTQVQNKQGEWVDFDPAKVRFVYTK